MVQPQKLISGANLLFAIVMTIIAFIALFVCEDVGGGGGGGDDNPPSPPPPAPPPPAPPDEDGGGGGGGDSCSQSWVRIVAEAYCCMVGAMIVVNSLFAPEVLQKYFGFLMFPMGSGCAFLFCGVLLIGVQGDLGLGSGITMMVWGGLSILMCR